MTDQAFGVGKRPLRDLLRQVDSGEIQLPEFQRGWVWPYLNIRDLLASISLSYPVGTVMLLDTGGEVRFKYRPVEGAAPAADAEPTALILDGQQRLTSLFQALALKTPVQTQDGRHQPVSGWFYVDMNAALANPGDREEAIRFLPKSRRIANFRGDVTEDYSEPSQEYAAHLFPLHAVFDGGYWGDEFKDYWEEDRSKRDLWREFNETFVRPFDRYQVPVIELGRGTPRQAVCQVFEKVNTGGVTLTVFELLTATYAAEKFDLRRHWEECRAEWEGPEYRILEDVSNTDFLQAITLTATAQHHAAAAERGCTEDGRPRIGCKRKDMLDLSLEDYARLAPDLVRGFKSAAKFLHQQYVFDTKFLPYSTQLIPLAAVFALAKDRATTAGAQEKLARWYWCGVFGELYGGSTETRFSQDLHDLLGWLNGASTEPRTILAAQFPPSRLNTLRTRNSAAYKGIYALLLKAGARDWRTGEPAQVNRYFEEAIDIHHIFPKTWCEKAGYSPDIYNSILNKTPLTARTNRMIGGAAPSEYLSRVARKAEVANEVLADHVRSHLCSPELMSTDSFDEFRSERSTALLQYIAGAMGKPLQEGAEDSEGSSDMARSAFVHSATTVPGPRPETGTSLIP